MTVSRRKMLALIGGGTILAATGGATAFAVTRTPHRALAPWGLAGSYGEIRRDALSWALLAPNPHNLQPWLAELRGDDAVALWMDPARRLPQTDPFDRQLHIGIGCFLELMRMAAAEAGHGIDLTLHPDGPEGPVALARFLPAGAEPDPLFAHAAARRSCKEPFADRPVDPEAAAELAALAEIHTDPEMVAALKQLTWEAWRVETFTPRTMQESVDLMRFGRAEIDASPDGIDLGGPFLEALMLAGIVNRAAQADQTSRGFQAGVDIYERMLAATPAYATLTSEENTRADQIEAGRRWLRLNLTTTALGLSLHPVSQALQEFPEMAPHHTRAHELLAPNGGTVQMLGRLGYGPDVAQTPRWPLEARLKT